MTPLWVLVQRAKRWLALGVMDCCHSSIERDLNNGVRHLLHEAAIDRRAR